MSDTTITAEERAEIRRSAATAELCCLTSIPSLPPSKVTDLLNALEQAESQLAAALQVNAARQAAVTADVLNAMMAGITGQKKSVRVEVEVFRCPYCNEISKTIEAATAHDAICPKHPAVMRAEKAEKELAGADAEISELRDELEDSRGTEKDAPNILCAIARLVGVFEHCQELGDDMGTMSLDAVQGLLAEKQKAEAENARLTKGRDWLANKLIDCPPEFTNCAVDCAECRKEAARRALAAGEETCQK